MTTSSTAPRIASVIARKSSISYEGTPSGVRAWTWIIEQPSSTARFASAAYSSGVYGMAGHWSRPATAPEIEQVTMQGSSKRLIGAAASRRAPPGRRRRSARSHRHHTMLLPRPRDPLRLRHLERPDHRGARLARVDHVVDQRVPGGDVGVDGPADALDHLGARGVRVLGRLDLLAEDDVDRALGAHHGDLGRGPGHDQVGLVRLAAHHVVARPVG